MSDRDVLCTEPAMRKTCLQILFKRPTLAIVFETAPKPTRLVTFVGVRNPWRLPVKMTVQHPKAVRAWCAFGMLTSEYASRHSCAQCLTSPTSTSKPH